MTMTIEEDSNPLYSWSIKLGKLVTNPYMNGANTTHTITTSEFEKAMHNVPQYYISLIHIR
jgi:hypothetical protein